MAVLKEELMENIVVISGCMHPDAEKTASWLEKNGNKVYRTDFDLLDEEKMAAFIKEIEEKEGKIDLLILRNEKVTEDGSIAETHDFNEILAVLDYNINGAVSLMEASIPLLRKSELKRIAVLTDRRASINYSADTRDYVWHMSEAALHMMEKLYFNQLRPEGFTFRCFGSSEEEGGITPGEYIMNALCYDPKEPYIHSDENRLVMRDHHYREIPW